MNQRLPSFLIIGAMKAATTTLYDQLNRQQGIFLPELKEPNFYSDDDIFNKGYDWYLGLFDNAQTNDLLGEASTHYTKLPTYPKTIERIKAHNPNAKLIYIMRNPINRLVSHYIHEWTQNVVKTEINSAIDKHPELIEYSLYHKQLLPFIEAFGEQNILPVFFERLMNHSQDELERVCKFIGYTESPTWFNENDQLNKSNERIRRFPLYDLLIESKLATVVRQNLIPKRLREQVKSNLQMKQRPQLSEENIGRLTIQFDKDLSQLGQRLGVALNCDNYTEVVTSRSFNWVQLDG